MNNATELLKEIYADLEYDSKIPLWLRDRVRDFLTTEKEAELEPVAWVKITQYGDRRLSLDKLDGYEPLYTKPEPARKPMTEEEIEIAAGTWKAPDYADGFVAGVRFAEKHHGIGGDDE